MQITVTIDKNGVTTTDIDIPEGVTNEEVLTRAIIVQDAVTEILKRIIGLTDEE